MTRFLTAVFAVCTSVGLLCTNVSAAPPTAPKTVVVDVSLDQLPTDVELHTGDTIVFVRPKTWDAGEVHVSFDYAPAQIGKTASPLVAETKLPQPNCRFVAISAMTVKGPGKGDFVLTFKDKSAKVKPRLERVAFKSSIARQSVQEATEGKVNLRSEPSARID